MPRVLDLYCGAGGASLGYHLAGFDVLGVDINPQKNYPFSFLQMDALDFRNFDEFDLIHASPPCQAHSNLRFIEHNKQFTYPDLIPQTRELLKNSGKPYVIENLPTSPLENTILLCGSMFNLNDGVFEIRRHRHFESSFTLPQLNDRCGHYVSLSVTGYSPYYRDPYLKKGVTVPKFVASRLMGITHATYIELAQMIPPAYTRWIGEQFLQRKEQ